MNSASGRRDGRRPSVALAACACVLLLTAVHASAAERAILNVNPDWRFIKADPAALAPSPGVRLAPGVGALAPSPGVRPAPGAVGLFIR